MKIKSQVIGFFLGMCAFWGVLASGTVVASTNIPKKECAEAGCQVLPEYQQDQMKKFQKRLKESGLSGISSKELRTSDEVKKYQKQLHEDEIDKVKNKKPDPVAQKTVKDFRNAPRQQEAIKQYQEDIWSKLNLQVKESKFSGYDKDKIGDIIEKKAMREPYAKKKVLVFISKSMPRKTIENYIRVLDGHEEAVLLIRGMVNNGTNIKETVYWANDLLCEDGKNCKQAQIDINPRLFAKCGINKVPAIAYIPEPLDLDSSKKYIYYGDVKPSYALQKIQMLRPNDSELEDIRQGLIGSWYKNENQNGEK